MKPFRLLGQMFDRIKVCVFDSRHYVDEDFTQCNAVSALMRSTHKVDSICGKLDGFLVHQMTRTGRVGVKKAL